MKKTLAVLFALVFAVSLCVPALGLTLDTAESAAESTAIPEEASLAATSIVPGVNVINGEAAVETFDDLTEIPSTITWSGWTSIGLASENAVTGNAIKAVSGAQYPKLYFDMVAEAGRKYYFHASANAAAAPSGANSYIFWIMQDGSSSNHVFYSVPDFTNDNVGTWITVDGVFASKTANPFYYQMQANKSGDTLYYDDLAIVPYYKITYSGTDTADYILFEDESVKDLSKLAASYTIKTDNYPEDAVIGGVYSKCIGWSTTSGATEPMTTVELTGSDITLYPVWQAEDFVTVDSDYMLGKTGTTYTVTASEPVEFVFDAQDTGAVIETTETSATITAAGYAGYVTLTVTSVEDSEKTVTMTIRLIGGDKYKPGLNLWTGTEDPYGFEDVDPSVVDGSQNPNARDKELVSVGSMSIAAKAKLDDAENMAVYFSGNFPHITMNEGTLPVIEAERPLYVAYNKMGAKGTSLLVIRNALNKADGAVRLKTDGLPNYESDWVGYYATVNPANLAVSNIGGPYVDDTQDVKNIVFMKASSDSDAWIDDIEVVPYYKITYIGLDGEAAATDYALVDNNGNLLDYYVPDNSKVTGATGFALEEGGEKVAYVNLENEDITLYAVSDSVTTYLNGKTAVNAAVEGETFTFPEAAEVFEGGISNFKAWYVDGVNYMPGEEVASSVVIGKNIEAVAFTAKLYDPAKGVLVAYADFEQLGAKEDTFAYVNRTYAPTITGLNGVNGMNARAVEAVDGENALRVHTTQSTGTWGAFRYGAYSMNVAEDAKYSTSINAKAIAPKYSGTDSVAIASRFNGGFIRFNTADPGIGSLTASWQTLSSSRELTSMTQNGINIYASSYASDEGTPDDTSDDITRYHLTDFYIDDFTVYCYPKNLIMYRASATSSDYVEHRAADVAGTYTFPTPEELGMEIPYFAAWTDGETKYKAGDEVTFTDIQYKNFYAYVQDPTTPAVAFAYEGGSVPSLAKASYGEQIEDDGRSVVHIHQWGTTYEAARNRYVTDTRAQINHAGFDAGLYNIVEYAYKVENANKAVNVKAPAEMTTEDYAAIDETEVRIFYRTNNGNGINFWGDASAGLGGEYLVGNGPFTVPVDSDYHVVSFDMGVKANGNATFPWISAADGMIYGFCVDPNKTGTFSGDMYIDYLRVYKDGDTTVTYDTNAPEGATVAAEVAADTGRGVGTGYLLTGKRPVVEGYVFKGWSLDRNATAEDAVISIDLTGDTTVYAIWESADANKAPAATTETSIRGTGDYNGLRFKATIMSSEMTGLEEFGFIATREDFLSSEDELTFAFKKNGANEKLYVSGVAYDKAAGINKINGEEEDGSIIYTAVATGIPLTAKNENMVMRTYAKYHINDRDIVLYGGVMNDSLYGVAKAIADENGEAYANNKEYIDSILAD